MFKGPQNYIENKSEGNENEIILGNFNSTMDKMDRDGGNKTQRLCRCGWTGMVETKYKDFVDVVFIMPC